MTHDRAAPTITPAQPCFVLPMSGYSAKTGLLSSHFLISLSRQPTERVAMLPNLTGAGKSPLFTRRQIVVFERPVTRTTSGILIILSIVTSTIAFSLPRTIPSSALLSDRKLLDNMRADAKTRPLSVSVFIPSGVSFHILAGRFPFL